MIVQVIWVTIFGSLIGFDVFRCSLDEELYKDCKEDAKKICNAHDFSGDFMALPPGMVLACLYRNSMPDTEVKVSFFYIHCLFCFHY